MREEEGATPTSGTSYKILFIYFQFNNDYIMTTYTPDAWKIIKLRDTYKVLGGWYGGYLSGDSWRMNSGIESIVEYDDHYAVNGYSGSVYICFKGQEKMTGLMFAIYDSWVKSMEERNSTNNTDFIMDIVEISDCIKELKDK